MTAMILISLAVLGVIFGSFVNALVWRLHEQERRGRKAKSSKGDGLSANDLSIMRGRSMCPNCHHALLANDLVPVLSWLALRGKCRYCGRPISWQYPAVELLTGALFALSYAAWPLGLDGAGLFQFVLWLVFVVGFVALTVYDIRWMLLPDRVVYPLSALAALQTVVVAVWRGDWAGLYMALLAAAIIFGLFWGLFQASKGRWIGGGDVKIAVVLGLLAGTPLHAFLVIFLASLFGTVGSLPALMRGRKGLAMHVPFGPYLLLATFVVVLWGDTLVAWYQNLLV